MFHFDLVIFSWLEVVLYGALSKDSVVHKQGLGELQFSYLSAVLHMTVERVSLEGLLLVTFYFYICP